MATESEFPMLMRLLRRIFLGALVVVFLASFVLWRIDNPRVENFRMAVIDRFVPSFDWTLNPVTYVARLVSDWQSIDALYEQNRELRRELQRMKGWREAALQLEETNARLRALNKVRVSPRLSFITGEVMTDSGSPFRQSALLNVGRIDGVEDGLAAVDGLGLVGRISGVGERTSRVVLLTDINSRLPVLVQPSSQRGLVTGDNTSAPPLAFLDDTDRVRPGDRVFTSGAGGVFPPDLLVGEVALDPQGQLRVRLSADYRRLEFLRILRRTPNTPIKGPGELIAPSLAPELTARDTREVPE
ncbi:MAG: rod shape-determining protein MreC [Pseudomonadota bacterium]